MSTIQIRNPLIALLAIAFGSTACKTARGPETVDTRRILAADQEPGNWLTHGRTYGEQRFSPLATVTEENVAQLGLAWSYQLKTDRGASATPLVVDGVMYVTSAWSLVYALDAANGRELWVYDPKVDRAVGAKACCDVVNRGVAVYEGKVYVGVIDGRLVALNASDGSVAWETITVDQSASYTITGAPRAANGLVYIGNGGADLGVRGYVSAYDAATGALVWRFYTVPGDPAKGSDGAASDSMMPKAAETWTGEWWKVGGGGTVWDAIVYDPEFGQLIIGVGNGSPWNRQIRSPNGGDNWFLASILALDAKTGAYRWHYQTTPGETWDYTATQPIVLADLTIDGQARKVAMQAPKNGFFYVVDRTNGALISAKPFIPMAATKDTPAGAPISWAYGVDPATGRPMENPEARYLTAPAVVRPSAFGAHNWHPMSFSPRTGLVYLPAQDLFFGFAHDPGFVAKPGFWNIGIVGGPLPDDPAVRNAVKNSATGALLAWDPVAQKEVWRAERPGAWNGGTLATAGGLVFQGTVDGRFLALDAATGKQLWEYDNQAATLAGPVSYQVGDEQYVAVAAGYGSAFFLIAGFQLPKLGAPINGRIYAFKLGGTAARPAIALTRNPTPKPPAPNASASDVAAGGVGYWRFCLVCHGLEVVSGGVLPDLRKSAWLHDPSGWREVVVGGSLKARGMPGFGEHLQPAEAERIRSYVISRANLLYAEEQTAKR